MVVGVHRIFGRLAAAIGRPDLIGDRRFIDNASRIVNDSELDEIIAAWIRERTCAEVMETFEQADVIAGRIYTVKDIFEDPHYRARNDIVDVPDPDFGTVKMPAVFPKFSGAECTVRWPGGRLGQHNAEVFGSLLGLSEAELADAESEGVI